MAAEFKLEAVAFLDDKLADGDVVAGVCGVLGVAAEAPYRGIWDMILHLLFMNYNVEIREYLVYMWKNVWLQLGWYLVQTLIIIVG